MSAFTNYMSRLEMILQLGKSRVDLAIYRDTKVLGNGGRPEAYYGDHGLSQAGYTYEYISPANLKLDTAVVENGVLAPGGPCYKALLINTGYSPETHGLCPRRPPHPIYRRHPGHHWILR